MIRVRRFSIFPDISRKPVYRIQAGDRSLMLSEHFYIAEVYTVNTKIKCNLNRLCIFSELVRRIQELRVKISTYMVKQTRHFYREGHRKNTIRNILGFRG